MTLTATCSATDPLGHATSYSYDGIDRNVSETDADGDVTRCAYDAAGKIASLTDPDGNVTSWTYDAAGQELSETNPLGTAHYAYDADGNLTQTTDRDGQTTQYVFDHLGRETAENWLDSSGSVFSTIGYSYDLDGDLTSAAAPAATDTFSYNSVGQVVSTTQQIAGLTPTVTLAQQFDADGNRTQVAATIGGTADFVNNYAYDSLGEMTQVTQSGVSGGNAVAEKRVDLAYDADGQYNTITRYADLAGTELVATGTYGFDADGNMTSLSYSQGQNTLVGYSWSYDAAGNMTQSTNTADGTVNYSYDPTNQLTGASSSNSQLNLSNTYDANGNRTNTGDVTGPDNELLSDGTYNYTYGGGKTGQV